MQVVAEQDARRLLLAYRADPALFVRQTMGAEPSPQQAELLREAAKPGAHVSVTSGHGTGKSTVLAWLAIWFVCLHKDSKCPVTAPTASQLESIFWAELNKWIGRLHPWFRAQLVVTANKLCVQGAEHTQFCVARTARKEKPEALQGFHATNLMFLVDEASGVPDAIFEAAEGSLSTPGARVILASNPTRNSGYFHRTHHKDRGHWVCLRFSCLDSPHVSPDYAKSVGERYGDDSDFYRVRVLGEFPRASSMQFIAADLVEEARGRTRYPNEYINSPVVLGVDVARFGDDKSVIFRRQGLVSSILGTHHGLDTMALSSVVAQHIKEQRPAATFVDVGSMGAGVIDRLRQLGHSVFDVNFGSKAAKDTEYTNKRAEMWGRVRDWLKAGGCIPDDSELCDDLTGLEYGFDGKERIQLESKEDMKKRGLASPDKADALAVTFAEHVAPADFDAEEPQSRFA